MAVIATMVSCAKFDYESILEQLCDHESRIQKLETLCNQLNSNTKAVQTIIQAQNSRDYVTDIVKIMENGVEVGYSITFAQSGTVTIYHGSDGADGAAPKIGIRKASDGEYYWTSDDEWMTDDQGEKIPASVPNDPDGKYITPSIRIAEGIWYISYDGGNTWQELEDISKDEEECDGEGGQFFTDVTYDDEYIYLTVKKMREAYPKAKIYLCTITMNNRGSKNTFPPCYGGKSMVSFNRAIRECAEFFGCGLLDLASCGVTYENLKTYAPDGTHLNAAGHELAGKKAIADFEPTKINKNEYQSGPLEYGSITSSPSGLRGGIVDYIAVKPDFHSSIIGKTIKKIKVYRVEDQGNPSAATIKIGKIKLESGFDSTSVTTEELNSAYKNISSVHTYNVSSFPYNKVMELECDITLYKNEYLCFVTKDGHCVGFCDNAVSEPQMMYYYNNVVNAYKTQHLPISVTVEN